jgi:hypothetical protein
MSLLTFIDWFREVGCHLPSLSEEEAAEQLRTRREVHAEPVGGGREGRPRSRCPYCGAPAFRAWDEVRHMEAHHPEIIEQRLRDAGMAP